MVRTPSNRSREKGTGAGGKGAGGKGAGGRGAGGKGAGAEGAKRSGVKGAGAAGRGAQKPSAKMTGAKMTGAKMTGAKATGAKRSRRTGEDAPRGGAAETVAGERIAKVLARAGVASRREAERMITEGRVRVNGRVLDSPALNVTGDDRVEVDGNVLAAAEPMRLWRYHKPAGLVTTERDEMGRPTVFERLPPSLPRVMSVGRLDLNSEGLLLLTNDGALKRRLELPATGWLRRYRVRVHGRPDEPGLERLRQGVEIDGERFRPMQVTLDRQQGGNAWLTVGLREGRNREVRRAMEEIGLPVNRLIRISYGPFQLGELPVGTVEEVRGRVLADQLGLRKAPSRAEGRRKPEKGGPG